MSIALRLKSSISERLEGTRVYVPLRTMYQMVSNPQFAHKRLARSNFYSRFLRPGCLVFDIGANYGEYSRMFMNLGARVIAVEPNPSCARILARGGNGQITVRCEAVGEREGETTMFIGAHSGHSTLSANWMQKASQTDNQHRWKGTLTVPLTTLDRLRQEYGIPDFIKIDVEGYEASVFRGMSFRPPALGFEFHACAAEQLRECLELPIFNGPTSFNLSLDDSWQFVWSDWRDKQAVLDYVATLQTDQFGDVYVLFSEPPLAAGESASPETRP